MSEETYERTELAEDRTVMALERTYASWMRTGMSSIGIALGFTALFGRLDPAWVPKSVATAFVMIGIGVFVAAERQLRKTYDRLHTHSVSELSKDRARIIAVSLMIAGLALVGVIWAWTF